LLEIATCYLGHLFLKIKNEVVVGEAAFPIVIARLFVLVFCNRVVATHEVDGVLVREGKSVSFGLS